MTAPDPGTLRGLEVIAETLAEQGLRRHRRRPRGDRAGARGGAARLDRAPAEPQEPRRLPAPLLRPAQERADAPRHRGRRQPRLLPGRPPLPPRRRLLHPPELQGRPALRGRRRRLHPPADARRLRASSSSSRAAARAPASSSRRSSACSTWWSTPRSGSRGSTVSFVPVSIGYERMMEEGALRARAVRRGQAQGGRGGAPQGRRGAAREVRARQRAVRPGLRARRAPRGLRRRRRREPLPPPKRRALVNRLAHLVMSEINRVTAVTPGSLVATALLLCHGRRGLSHAELVEHCRAAREARRSASARGPRPRSRAPVAAATGSCARPPSARPSSSTCAAASCASTCPATRSPARRGSGRASTPATTSSTRCPTISG